MKCCTCGKEDKPDKLEGSWIGGEVQKLIYTHKGCKIPKITEITIKKETDPERIISEVGAMKLSETREGRAVLEKARRKYKAELVQPGDPEFKKLYGKQLKEQAEIRRENERIAQRMWEDKGGREK